MRLRPILSTAVLMAALASPAAADLWYQHYDNALQALAEEDWATAVAELNLAIERKGDSGVRVRTYGMRTRDYFPYLKLGIAYFHLGRIEAAAQALDTEERLGAVDDSEDAAAELALYRGRIADAREESELREEERVRRIVAAAIEEARDLEAAGRLEEAVAALDRALAVAPEDPQATAAIERLRGEIGRREELRAAAARAEEQLEEGEDLIAQGRLAEAAGRLRQAVQSAPAGTPTRQRAESMLDETQGRLRRELEAQRDEQERRRFVATGLADAEGLETAGDLDGALARVEEVLALAPGDSAARDLRDRLLAARERAEVEQARQASVTAEIGAAEEHFAAGRWEETLAGANRALALDPGNRAALDLAGQAYGRLSDLLLGEEEGSRIPPAIRFDDLRDRLDDGSQAQVVTVPDFRLSGLVIDDLAVEIVFYDPAGRALGGQKTIDLVGDLWLVRFRLDSRLDPGPQTFRLVATGADGLSSSGEYTVLYHRPFFLAPWFHAAAALALAAGAGGWWARRARRRARLRRRRFNPYVAGPPVLDEDLFFGREKLIERILATVHNNSLLLHGERRIGKTSLQHHLKRRLERVEDPGYAFFPVYIDLQGAREERFFAGLAEEIFEELGPGLDGLTPGREPSAGGYGYRDLVRDLRAVLGALERRSRPKKVKLVLLIDEVDELNAYDPRVNQRLRSLFMKSFAESLVAVVSGVEIVRRWQREGSPWYNFFEEIEVPPLDPGEAQALVERPLRGVLGLEEGLAERVVAATGGRPYLIQKLCVALVGRAYEKGRRVITAADLEALGRPETAEPVLRHEPEAGMSPEAA